MESTCSDDPATARKGIDKQQQEGEEHVGDLNLKSFKFEANVGDFLANHT